ncbi:MAG: TolC family protein [Melioribacteraceae bacterium]|nr:TolC family protein [Melioribacteraceae bacterium]
MKQYLLLFIFLILSGSGINAQEDNKTIIFLSLDEVVGIAKSENLSLKSKILDYDAQNLEVWRSVSNFLPNFSYQGIATNNFELPVFVFMGQRFVVGTKYTFQHGLDLTLPLFTGGMRWFNINVQKSLKKSLKEELEGKEEETVLQSLQAYYGIILANSFYKTASEAAKAAEANLEQVRKFYDAGTATELDLQRAKAQYASTLPKLERAKSEKKLSAQRLKFLLNLSFEDSLVVTDSLSVKEFLDELYNVSLEQLKELSLNHRSDIKSLIHRLDAVEEGEKIALGKFLPTIALSASVMHQAPLETASVRWNDYIRSKSLTLSMSWPIFEGGRKIIDYQQAKIRSEQMKILFEQADDKRILDVEESYAALLEAVKNLESLKEAKLQAEESLRLSNLLYSQGMSTQLDVLNAQLFHTSSKTEYFQGIFNYNVSQLNLLYSIGLLDKIWN